METHLIVAWRPIKRRLNLKQVQMKIDKIGSIKLAASQEDNPGVLTALDLHVLATHSTPIDRKPKASAHIACFKKPVGGEHRRLVLEDLFLLEIELILKFSKTFDSAIGPLEFEGNKSEISLKVWAFPRSEGEEPFYQLNQADCDWASILRIDKWPASIFMKMGTLLAGDSFLKWVHSPTSSTIQIGDYDPVRWKGLESIQFEHYFTQVMGMMSTLAGTPFGKLEVIEIVLIVVGMWLQKSQSQHARAFQYYNQLREAETSDEKDLLLQKILKVLKSTQICLEPLMLVAIDHVLQADLPESEKESAQFVKQYYDTLALMLEQDQSVYEHLEPFLKKLPNLSIAQCLMAHSEMIKEHLSGLVNQNPPNPELRALLETEIQSSYSTYINPNHASVWELVVEILEGTGQQKQTFYRFSGETQEIKCEDPQELPLRYGQNHLIYYSDHLKVVGLQNGRNISLDLVSSSKLKFCQLFGNTIVAVQFREQTHEFKEETYEFIVATGDMTEILSIPEDSESVFFHYLQKRTTIHKIEDIAVRKNQEIRYHYRSGKLYCVVSSMEPHQNVYLIIIDTKCEIPGSQMSKFPLPEIQYYLGDNPPQNLVKITHRSKGKVFSICSHQTTGAEHKQQEVHVGAYVLGAQGNTCQLLVDQVLRDLTIRAI